MLPSTSGGFVNKPIQCIKIYNPRLRYTLPQELTCLENSRILEIARIGKLILLKTTAPDFPDWAVHLGMTGVFAAGKTATLQKEQHKICEFAFSNNGETLAYFDIRRFGYILPAVDSRVQKFLNSLGEDALKIEQTSFVAKIKSKAKTPIKTALLDQRVVAGIGNIYACEMLFVAKIHPCKACASISHQKLGKLFVAMNNILEAAVQAGGSSIKNFEVSGKPGYFQFRHFVYAKEGNECSICKTSIKMLKIAGRSSFFCPKCQKT